MMWKIPNHDVVEYRGYEIHTYVKSTDDRIRFNREVETQLKSIHKIGPERRWNPFVARRTLETRRERCIKSVVDEVSQDEVDIFKRKIDELKD